MPIFYGMIASGIGTGLLVNYGIVGSAYSQFKSVTFVTVRMLSKADMKAYGFHRAYHVVSSASLSLAHFWRQRIFICLPYLRRLRLPSARYCGADDRLKPD